MNKYITETESMMLKHPTRWLSRITRNDAGGKGLYTQKLEFFPSLIKESALP